MYLLISIVLALCSSSVRGQEACGCSSDFIESTNSRIGQLESSINMVSQNIGSVLGSLSQELQSAFMAQQQEMQKILTQVAESAGGGMFGGMGEGVEQIMGFVTAQLNVTSQELAYMKKEFNDQAEEMKAFIESQQEKMEALEEKLEEQEEKESKEEEENEQDSSAIAFYFINHKKYRENPPVFKTQITNVGNAYDQEAGVFTCPVAGIYLFTLSVQTISVRGKNVHCHILLNGDVVTYAQTAAVYADMSSVSTFLSLSRGDEVTLGDCGGWDSAYSGEGTSFGGVLIKEMPQE